ncbi:MAG: Grx4 family monothiol glutaredoxin [Janthinobacterium lividum]
MQNTNILEFIEDQINSNDIVLFIKGTKDFPQCGFSAKVIGIMNEIGANFEDINVLANEELRQGIKDFSDWPTVPQMYVRGEFIGGCDIISEMYTNGDLITLLKDRDIL